MTTLTERQLDMLRELQFQGGSKTILVVTEKAVYEELANKGYVVST